MEVDTPDLQENFLKRIMIGIQNLKRKVKTLHHCNILHHSISPRQMQCQTLSNCLTCPSQYGMNVLLALATVNYRILSSDAIESRTTKWKELVSPSICLHSSLSRPTFLGDSSNLARNRWLQVAATVWHHLRVAKAYSVEKKVRTKHGLLYIQS